MSLLPILALLFISGCTIIHASVAEPHQSASHPAVPFAHPSLEALDKLINIFNHDMFKKHSVKDIAAMSSSVLGLGIAIVGWIWGPDSGENAYLRQEFAALHAKLDSISIEMKEVKELIEWTGTRLIYAKYENHITVCGGLFNAYAEANDELSREVALYKFYDEYEKEKQAALHLYTAIVEADYHISSNLAAAAASYTNNHRRQVMNFLLGMQRLIMRGAELEIAYDTMEHGEEKAQIVKSTWDGRMEKLIARMKELETEIKEGYLSQMRSDLSDLLKRHHGMSHADFAHLLIRYCDDKFDWLRWVALVFDRDRHGMYDVSYCNGIESRGPNGRNVFLVSADPETSLFTKQKGQQALEFASQFGTCQSKDLVQVIRHKIPDCQTATFVASVCWTCGLQIVSTKGHHEYRLVHTSCINVLFKRFHTAVFG